MEIKEINGNEIIDFLNSLTEDEHDELYDSSISEDSYEFVSQEIKNNKYILHFTAGFNNWGTLQDIYGNRIVIDKDGVTFCLEEPFCDDGSADVLETILTEWLKTHKFIDASKSLETFNKIVDNAYKSLSKLKFEEKDKLQSIIDELIKAKTYMK